MLLPKDVVGYYQLHEVIGF
ncbi:hypothetical protein ACHAWO_012890 [Cyclotella atomus]|uniref:Uncharacterized protein n=1 Tax=Cyclotella atomus TaxID=382360 RepID=A0ABD3QT94_9STRA